MARSPKLKVYATSVGFYDALVAAPSQKAALDAWGTTTNLFAAGRASVVDDPELQAEALARPGEVVKRPHGDAKTLIAAMEAAERAEAARPEVARPEVASSKKVAPGKKVASVKERPEPPRPDRSELDAAERAVADAERDLRNSLDEIAAQRADLDQRERRVRAEGEDRIRVMRERTDAAASAYRRAVGTGRR